MEPGKDAFARITIAVKREDEAEILELKHKLEAKSGERISISELFRQGIKCLREREGLA